MIDSLFKRRFKILVFFVVVFAGFLRFYNYFSRFGIAYDQAHDALVARYAVESLSFPLVGPFSSGAQFQAAGVWYWFLMIPTFLFRDFFLAPWVFTTIFCTLFVLAITLFGAKLVDKKFGILVGLLAAISTSQIGQSTNLSLTALMSFVSLGAIFFIWKYIKDSKNINLFMLGFFVGLSPVIHLQGVLLVVLIPVFLIVVRPKQIKSYLYIALGICIPLIPLMVFDLQNNFVNVSGLLNHLFNKQYEVSYDVLGRRWLTYIFVFWPNAWANIVGGYMLISYITIGSIAFVIVKKLFKFKNFEKVWLIISITFLIDVCLMRYVRSPLFDSYLNFLHPFIFLLTSYAIYYLIRKKWIIGILLLVIVVFGSLYRDIGEVSYPGSYGTSTAVTKIYNLIYKKYPNKKFDFYDYEYKQAGLSLPLVLRMDVAEKTDNRGIKIGLISIQDEASISGKFVKLIGKSGGLVIVELIGSESGKLQKAGWHPVNPSYIYDSTENWYKK